MESSAPAKYDESQINKGLSLAQNAITQEREGIYFINIGAFPLGKIDEALRSYQEAVLCFKSQVDMAPLDRKNVFGMFLKNYEEKAEQLKQVLKEAKEMKKNLENGVKDNEIEEQFVIVNENPFEKDFQDLDLHYDME